MKFWQLVSITSEEAGLIVRVASTSPNWKKYESLAIDFSHLVKVQDRTALDTEVDADFVTAVLQGIQEDLYLSSDNWLRSWRMDATDQVISLGDSCRRYGADIVEAVCERGAVKISAGKSG